jgi:deoxyribonuclease I
MRPWPARVASVVVALALLVVALTDAGVSHTGGRAEAIQGNTTIQSFHKAKTLAREVFAGHERTFYCDCPYSGTTGDLTSCGYQPKKTRERAERLEWEHVVPADAFGQSFVEWREGNPECVDRKGHAFKGRNCARKMALPFRFMEADLYNRQPESAEVNLLRSNYSMEMISGEERKFGSCDLEIADRKIEPRPDIRGDIARTYFYMNAAYPRRRRIEQMQGNRHPFVMGKQ